ncbi:uncharacterized protein [Haliotis cracherodii]|uniref:uncharacterized protein isoform X2 n=1 Tax=Haliotis cracherodii TaxID=6455 RepID=UPI0039ECCE55
MKRSGRRRSSIVNIHKGESHKQNVQRLRKLFHSVRFISKLRPCLSESYFTVRGAALILPQGERPRRSSKKSHGGDIQHHLQSMLYLLRHEDRIKVAVKLEPSSMDGHQRYMALVSTVGRQDTEESVVLGIDYVKDLSTIGLVLPIYNGTQIRLDGDGGFSVKVSADDHKFLFKPVSVQAMWSALQSLQKAVKVAEDETYIPNGLTHTWVQYYMSQVDNSTPGLVSQWNVMEGVEINLSCLVPTTTAGEASEMKARISRSLREVMMNVDLDVATSRSLRQAVEEAIGAKVTGFREYFDSEMMRILGQMDAPSQILDFLYLGTEWNASNIDELNENGVKYILNVTREIDNFFPGQLKYMNIRLYDVEESQLMPHWEKTYRFISKAKKSGSKVLVHCKRGISRSASTVIAYLMKENKWSLDDTYEYVHERRNVVRPNDGFMEQLRTYEGILSASNQRHIFKSQSAENLVDIKEEDDRASEAVFLEGDDLYRRMFESGYNPASEEEVLRSLGKGRDLEDADMVHIGADLETGSRSTDSLEESLPDIPSPTPDQQDASFKKKSSTRGEYSFTTQYDEAVATSGEVAGLDMIQQEYASDAEDEPTLVCPAGRCSQNASPVISISDCGGGLVEVQGDLPHVSSQSRLRPDNSWIKLEAEENMPAQEEAVFGDNSVSGSPPKFVIGDDEFMSAPVPESKDEGDVKMGSPVMTKVKQSESKGARVRSASMGEEKDIEECEKCEENLTKLSIRNRAASLGSRKAEEDAGVPDDKVSESIGCQEGDKVMIDKMGQLGIRQYYTREQIPWCPGTVKKMRSDFSKNLHSSDEENESGQKESKRESPTTDDPVLEMNIMEVTGPPEMRPKGNKSERLTQSCVELPSHDDDEAEFAALDLRRPKSVYEEEDIQLPQGMVRIFKDRLEAYRTSSDDSKSSTESRPIQRSASLKEERESLKSKRSERRKTCSPILSPTQTAPFCDGNVAPGNMLPEYCQREETLPEQDDGSGQTSESQFNEEGDVCDNEKNITVVKCGNEEVPLAKGLVQKHKQDFENRNDTDTRKRLSSESSVSSMTLEAHDSQHSTKDDTPGLKPQGPDTDQPLARQAGQTSDRSSPTSDFIPSNSACDQTEYSNSSVVSERLIRTVREQTSILEGKETLEPEIPPVSRVSKKSKKEDKSSIDPQIRAKMREMGSEFLNQPQKEPEEEVVQDLTLVKQVVRNIEKDTKVKKPERKIIIIEEGKKGEAAGKGGILPLSEKSKSFDDSGSVGLRRTRQWVKDGGSASFESSDMMDKDFKENRLGLCLNLEEQGVRSEDDEHHNSNGNISPRSDSELSIVRHLVGRFENIKSPTSDSTEGCRSNRSSVGEFGLCFVDSKKKKDEEDSMTGVEMRWKQSGFETSRPVRPKSADHIAKHDPGSQVKVHDQTEDLTSSHEHLLESGKDERSDDARKVRRVHGQSNPVTQRLGASPFYNTM